MLVREVSLVAQQFIEDPLQGVFWIPVVASAYPFQHSFYTIDHAQPLDRETVVVEQGKRSLIRKVHLDTLTSQTEESGYTRIGLRRAEGDGEAWPLHVDVLLSYDVPKSLDGSDVIRFSGAVEFSFRMNPKGQLIRIQPFDEQFTSSITVDGIELLVDGLISSLPMTGDSPRAVGQYLAKKIFFRAVGKLANVLYKNVEFRFGFVFGVNDVFPSTKSICFIPAVSGSVYWEGDTPGIGKPIKNATGESVSSQAASAGSEFEFLDDSDCTND